MIGEALALIHGELQAIRAVLERNELAASGEALSSGVPAAAEPPKIYQPAAPVGIAPKRSRGGGRK